MMPRKKRRTIIIVSIILVVLVLMLGFVLVYLNTDMFKSNKELFSKYLGKSVDNFEGMSNASEEEIQFKQLLELNKYTTNIQVKANYTQNVGTTIESADNVINKLKLNLDSQIDKVNQYKYQEVTLLKEENEISKIEYIQNQEEYGVRFSDLIQQFIMTNSENLFADSEKLGINNEIVNLVTGKNDITEIINNILLTEKEKNQLIANYLNVLKNNISNDKFSKQSNKTIVIDEKNVQVDAYILKLTKEELNNLFVKTLEQLKQDEIILNKIDAIQSYMGNISINDNTVNDNNINNSNINDDNINDININSTDINDTNINEGNTNETNNSLKDTFIEYIDEMIKSIENNNIGTDETSIIVYQNRHKTVGISVNTSQYEVDWKFYKDSESTYMELKSEDLGSNSVNTNVITYRNTGNNLAINYTTTQGEETIKYSLSDKKTIETSSLLENIAIVYEDKNNKVGLNIDKKDSIVNSFSNQIELDDSNSVQLNELDEDSKGILLTTVKEAISNKYSDLQQQVDVEDLNTALKAVGILKEIPIIEPTGTPTEAERSRFNSQFELFVGEKLKSESVKQTIENIKGNLSGVEIASDSELKLNITRIETEASEEAKNALLEVIEKNRDRLYTIKMDYNTETGLIQNVILMVEPK